MCRAMVKGVRSTRPSWNKVFFYCQLPLPKNFVQRRMPIVLPQQTKKIGPDPCRRWRQGYKQLSGLAGAVGG